MVVFDIEVDIKLSIGNKCKVVWVVWVGFIEVMCIG